ncbi:MAG: DUF4339 domain-containing protein [Planctomycetes bacterium]|nr:DUF4339 domain-containing protein [Planctomycetota bacterium]
MASLEWYYAKGNKQHGPVSAAELKKLAEKGELKPGDLVWRGGMEQWIPARSDPALKRLFPQEVPAPPPKPATSPPKAAPAGAKPPAFRKSDAAFDTSQPRPRRHVFDLVLEFARGQFTLQFVDLTSKIFTLAGHYGLYAAMVVLFAFSLLLGVRMNEVNTILLGTGGVVILLVLQYAAGRFFEALETLNRSTPGKMASGAFLDCFALLHVFGGLVALLGLAVMAVQTGPILLVLPAIATFILCQYVAVLALNPESLNLTIVSQTTAGEEAIGVLSFLVKLGLRIVPVAFGVGVVWGALVLLYSVFLVFAPPETPEELIALVGLEAMETLEPPEDDPTPDAFQPSYGGEPAPDPLEASSDGEEMPDALKMLPAMQTASGARTILITFAALPFLTYVFFLVYNLLIDVLRAVLSLPGKLDKMIDKR